MKLFVFFASLLVSVSAAPTFELLHPSPVNPDVLVATKPEEKITLITDPKEIAKFKRETKQTFYPTPLPEGKEHHITKRDHKTIYNTPCLVNPQKTQQEIERNKLNSENKADHSEIPKTLDLQKPQTLPLLISEDILKQEQHKRDIPVPLVPKHHHPEESPKESSESEPKASGEKAHTENKNLEKLKRDIPVSLDPKHHHSESSQKTTQLEQISKDGEQKLKNIPQQQNESEVLLSNDKKGKNSQQKDDTPLSKSKEPQINKPNIHDDHLSSSGFEKSTTQHPLVRPHPVPVSELFANRGHVN